MSQRPFLSAADAGWHESRYNLRATPPEAGRVAIVNHYRGTCAEYGPSSSTHSNSMALTMP